MLWINVIIRANWTPTKDSRVCQAHFEESIFLRKSPEGRWHLIHITIPTLLEHSKIIKNESSHLI
uniref:Putative LOC100570331 [Acyrthosiphon pisum] n=1 Tax=Lepeophtheirus salmonis TaxID=72036 RepID=A0A0K2TM11_LEPSM